MSQFYIMKAHHLTGSGRKLGLKKVLRDGCAGSNTILIASRTHGWKKPVPCFIIGSGVGYGVKPGDITSYTIDTGMGYTLRDSRLEIEGVLLVKDGVVTHSINHAGEKVRVNDMPKIPNRYTWVMK